MAEDTQQRLIRYLNDAHAVEAGALVATTDLAHRAQTPEVKRLAESVAQIIESQIARLSARIVAVGGKVNKVKDAQMALMATPNRLSNAFHDQADKETQDVIKSYTLAHGEVGMYTSLREYAEAIGDAQTAHLAQTLIAEEVQAAEKYLALVPPLARKPAYTTPKPGVKPIKSSGVGGLGVGPLAGGMLIAGSTALAAWGVKQMLAKKDGGSSAPKSTNGTDGTHVVLEEVTVITEPGTTVSAGMVDDIPTSGSVGTTGTLGNTGDVTGAGSIGYVTTSSSTTPATTTASGDLI